MTRRKSTRRLGEKSRRLLEDEAKRLAVQIENRRTALDQLISEIRPQLRWICRKLGIHLVRGALKLPKRPSLSALTADERKLFLYFCYFFSVDTAGEGRDVHQLKVLAAALSASKGRPESLSPAMKAALQEYDDATGKKPTVRQLAYRHCPVKNESARRKFADALKHTILRRKKLKSHKSY